MVGRGCVPSCSPPTRKESQVRVLANFFCSHNSTHEAGISRLFLFFFFFFVDDGSDTDRPRVFHPLAATFFGTRIPRAKGKEKEHANHATEGLFRKKRRKEQRRKRQPKKKREPPASAPKTRGDRRKRGLRLRRYSVGDDNDWALSCQNSTGEEASARQGTV